MRIIYLLTNKIKLTKNLNNKAKKLFIYPQIFKVLFLTISKLISKI